MESYVVSYINGGNLFDGYREITGKNPKDALKKAYNKDYRRVTGDDGAYSDVILIKGRVEGNTIRYKGRYQQLCYREGGI